MVHIYTLRQNTHIHKIKSDKKKYYAQTTEEGAEEKWGVGSLEKVHQVWEIVHAKPQ